MAEVVDISIDRQRSLTVTFDDEVTVSFLLTDLRQACPCAGCRGARERGQEPWTPRLDQPPPTIADASLVGAWGLSVRWDDGHDAGIYSWDLLHQWAERPAPNGAP